LQWPRPGRTAQLVAQSVNAANRRARSIISDQLPLAQPLPFNGFSLDGVYLAAVLVCCADNSDGASAIKALEAYAPASAVEFPAVFPYPQSFLFVTDTDVVVAVAGTQTTVEWIYNVLGSPQGSFVGLPGDVSVWFYQAATTVMNKMQADILAAAPGKRVTFIGHSLGGAIVQIMYQLLIGQIVGEAQVYTFGCPRVGDATFAAAFGINKLFRIENLDDPIPSLPPLVWAYTGSSYPFPGVPPFAFYTNGGVAKTLNYQGYLADGSTPSATQAIVNALQGTQPYNAHMSAEYVRRLGLQLPIFDAGAGADFEVQNAAIETIIDPQNWRLQNVAIAPPALCKVEVFYSFQGDGFSEIWYSNATPLNLQQVYIPNYVNQRLTLATAGVKALYARISLIGQPRQITFWVPGYAYTPNQLGKVKGGTSGSQGSLVPQAYNGTWNGFDVQPQQALLVRIQNTGNFWSRLFLHGFPAEIITGGFYTPTPNWNLTFNTFWNFLQGSNSGWLNVSTTPNQLGNRVSIISITANPSRGATVIYTVPAIPPPLWPPVVGMAVTIGGAGALEYGMNGRKTVIGIVGGLPAGQGGMIVGGTSPIGAGPQSGQAYFYTDALKAYPLQIAIIERLTTHKVGKPVFEPVGRRKNTIPLRR
jgi:pimeloyl-ACP methyl ester carboxylesterase